jgi:class 3 adenylate cyclase
VQQIADWLKTLGMSEYAERFAENDIDTSVLRDLTDQDLKELGVSLGHRRKMLRAIAELSCVAPTSQQPALTEPAKFLGDGVLVYFGYPHAHEDDAERAVRAGLQLVAAVGDLKTTRAPLQTRVGIATGLGRVDKPIDARIAN